MKLQQKGGSVASDAVTSLVSADTYSQMSKSFTNHVGEQCGGSLCKKCGRRVGGKKKTHRKHHSVKKGGDGVESIFKSFTNSASTALGLKSNAGAGAAAKSSFSVFQSSPAPAYNAVLPRNVGVAATNAKAQFTNSETRAPNTKVVTVGPPKASNSAANAVKMQFSDPIKPPTIGGSCQRRLKTTTGGSMRSLSDLMARNSGSSYSVKNKRGGASSDTVGLNYNAIKSSSSTTGPSVDRSPSGVVDRLLATEQVPSLPLIQKFTQYGSPVDSKMTFTYSGDRVSVPPPKVGGKKGKKSSHAKKAAKTLTKSKTSKSKK